MPHTLLLADDSVTIQRVIELTFAEEDVRVVAVSDGDQAIERLEAAPPDIVLADIGMPGRDGYEVARYIRQSPKLAHIPVVLLTGAFEPVDQAKAAEVGCDGVLAKPFEPQLVINRVRELLDAFARKTPGVSDIAPPSFAIPEPWVPEAARETAAKTAGLDEPVTLLDEYFDRLNTALADSSRRSALTEPAQQLPVEPAPSLPEELTVEPGTASTAWEPAPFAEPAPASDPPTEWQRAAAPPDQRSATGTEPRMPADDEPATHEDWNQFEWQAREAPVPAAAAADLPVSYASPMTSFEQPPEHGAPADREPASAAPAPPPVASPPPPAAGPIAARPLPTIAEAFATLLAAEQQEARPASRPVWPAPPPPPPQETRLDLTDDMLERIVDRVLERLSDRVVRETVAEIAERMVRDEIARIKASIR